MAACKLGSHFWVFKNRRSEKENWGNFVMEPQITPFLPLTTATLRELPFFMLESSLWNLELYLWAHPIFQSQA